MERNEIIKAYGTDFTQMTQRLLEYAGLEEIIRQKQERMAGVCGQGEMRPEKMRIAIKPNLLDCTPADYGATTHPEIVEGIIRYLQARNYTNITIMEGAWVGGNTQEAFKHCGYRDIEKRYGVPLIDCQHESSYRVSCAGMELSVCSCYQDVDFLINVPVLKGHCQTQITCALKNMKGLIPNSEKRRFHTLGLHKPIAHLNTHIHQDFIVVDHICGDPDFEEGGNPLVRNCIMCALDPVLTDAYTATILGYGAREVGYVKLAEQLGVGSADAEAAHIITIEGVNCEDMPDSHKVLAVSYAVEDVDSCSACYAVLISALNRLKEEGFLDKLESRIINDRIAIGQGYRGRKGKCGVGNCTRLFDFNIPGCPPSEDEIYEALKERYEN